MVSFYFDSMRNALHVYCWRGEKYQTDILLFRRTGSLCRTR